MEILQNISLKQYNTFRLEAKAEYFVEISSEKELIELFYNQEETGKYIVIGNGSNIIFSQDFDGIVIKNKLKGIKVEYNSDERILLEVASGEDFSHFVEYCAINNYCGIENLANIPSSVGASVVQNIGAYGVEIKDVVDNVKYFDPNTKQFGQINNRKIKFDYRDSIFKHDLSHVIITSVTFSLKKKFVANLSYGNLASLIEDKENLTPKQLVDIITNIRNQKLPKVEEYGSCGSFFKNPIVSSSELNTLKKHFENLVCYPTKDKNFFKLSAGQLIDLCGLKDYRQENVGTWKNQALVIVNYGSENPKEILNFAEYIRQFVYKKTKIKLEPEVCIL